MSVMFSLAVFHRGEGDTVYEYDTDGPDEWGSTPQQDMGA